MSTTYNKDLESPDLNSKRTSLDVDPTTALPTLAHTGAITSPATANANDIHEKENDTETSSQTSVYIPQKYRWMAFSMIIFFATGSSFAEGTLGPLKSTLVKQLKINSKSSSYIYILEKSKG